MTERSKERWHIVIAILLLIATLIFGFYFDDWRNSRVASKVADELERRGSSSTQGRSQR